MESIFIQQSEKSKVILLRVWKWETPYLINCRMKFIVQVKRISGPQQFGVTNDDDGQLVMPSSEFLRKQQKMHWISVIIKINTSYHRNIHSTKGNCFAS